MDLDYKYVLDSFFYFISFALPLLFFLLWPVFVFIPLGISSLILSIIKRKNFKIRTLFLSFFVVSITALICFSPFIIIGLGFLINTSISLILFLISLLSYL